MPVELLRDSSRQCTYACDVKEAVHARDLKPGDRVRFENQVWQVGGQFLEPPDVVDLDLVCENDTLNLHVGAGDLFELVT